jgi:hypothetical protein
MKWIPTKGTYADYCKQTALQLKTWYEKHGIQPIHVRVLVAYYVAAWRERCSAIGIGDRPLLWVRLLRARDLWESLKARPIKKRREEQWAQRGQGLSVAWEDLLVKHVGLFWLSGQTRSKQDWMKGRDCFIQEVCASVGLTLGGYRQRRLEREEQKETRDPTKSRLNFKNDMPEAEEIMDTPSKLLTWSRWERCFLFITDSKSLADVVCGRAATANEADAALLGRIVDGLLCMYDAGWRPPRLQDDPVAWMARSNNKVADGLADLTMDQERSWTRAYTISLKPLESNLVIQTDGGRRSATCAAASLVIGLCAWRDGTFLYEPWLAEGIYMTSDMTVFQTEAVALECAVQVARMKIQSALQGG